MHRSPVTLPFDHLRIVQIDLHKVLLLCVVAIERPARQEKDLIDILHINLPNFFFIYLFYLKRVLQFCILDFISSIMSHLHARDQHHLEDMLDAGGGVSHGNVEGPVGAEGHLPQVALRLLAVAIVGYVDVGEHAVEVEACLLACNNNKYSEHRAYNCSSCIHVPLRLLLSNLNCPQLL